MELTDWLVRQANTFGPSVWWHETREPTMLVGPAMHSAGRSPAPMAIRVVRRPTGGGAVLAGPGVLGLDIALPVSHPLLTGDIVEDYRWLGRVWEATLHQLGVNARSLPASEARGMASRHLAYADASLACFAVVAPHEVLAGGKKLVGLSQVRRSGGVLFSSAIHLDVSPSSVSAALALSPQRRHRLAAHLSRHAAPLNEFTFRPVSALDVSLAFRASLLQLHKVVLRKGAWPKPARSALPTPAVRDSTRNETTGPITS